jgi:hypothetical protein
MIGQYLPNNNEKRYSVILPKFLHLNRPSTNTSNVKKTNVRKKQKVIYKESMLPRKVRVI